MTRFVTSDSLAQWLFVDRLTLWAEQYDAVKKVEIHKTITELENVSEFSVHLLVKQNYLEETLAQYDGVHTSPLSWQARLVSMLSCPFCIGFWIGAINVLITVIVWDHTPGLYVWGTILAIFSLNYLVGHISARVD